jgi:beta-lactamase superfamily II metal-dependent hydrolase
VPTLALEALQANHGDALLVHWGTRATPRTMLVDGGPSPTYRDTLRHRLLALAAERHGGALDLDLLMVSHIDEDHIEGIQSLLGDLTRHRLPELSVRRFWLNSFDELTGDDLESGFVSASSRGRLSLAQIRRRVGPRSARIVASVSQGRSVAERAARLGLDGNPPFTGLVMRRRRPRTVTLDGGLELTVLGPSKDRVDDLREHWGGTASDRSSLAYVDDSIPNLSSIVVIARAAHKTMLLTGDARGDDILDGLRAAGRLRDGPARFHLLKLPHHGSDRNVETEFFRRVVADHYVVSADGSHDNPELATLQMLTEARAGDAFTIHFTNREPRLEDWFRRNKQRSDRYEVRFRRKDRPSIRVDLTS